jgi:hypothetical protein
VPSRPSIISEISSGQGYRRMDHAAGVKPRLPRRLASSGSGLSLSTASSVTCRPRACARRATT